MPVCTIKILDEVNCRIEGLDIATRRKCSNLLSYILPYAYHTPAFKLGRWNGKVSFFSIGGVTQINLLEKIFPILEDANYEIEIEDNRPKIEFAFDKIDENVVSNICWPATHSTHANQPIILQNHQVTVVNNFLDNLQSVQVVATGGGKTITTGTLSKVVENYGRTIIIVPSKQLVEQTLEDYLLLGLDAGVYYGDQKDWNKQHTICTWQSLERLLKKTKDGEVDEDGSITSFIKNVVAVIVDECLHPETLVSTPNGLVKISDLAVGDQIYSFDEVTKEIVEDKIVKVHENLTISSNEEMYELVFDTNEILKVTGNHKILTENRGWVRADELTEFDEIISFNKYNK